MTKINNEKLEETKMDFFKKTGELLGKCSANLNKTNVEYFNIFWDSYANSENWNDK